MYITATCKRTIRILLTLGLLWVASAPAVLFSQQPYRSPPQAVIDVLDAPTTPMVTLSPNDEWLVLSERVSMPLIREVAAPQLWLAGRRISPRTNGPASPAQLSAHTILRMSDGSERRLSLPAGGVGATQWAPDGGSFAFTRTTGDGIELWVANPETGQARAVTAPELNAARGPACTWMPDSRSLLCHFVPQNRTSPPERGAPTGPVIQEASGQAAPVWTFQDLLQDAHDGALYDHYLTSQPALVDTESGSMQPLGAPAIFEQLVPSPSGEFFLAVRTVQPYSYLVPDIRFPKVVEVWDRQGQRVQTIASLPVDESGPEHMGAARAGPRSFAWRGGRPATLVYVEALDGGDPALTVPHRDRVVMLAAPFDGAPVELIRTAARVESVLWGQSDALALVHEFDWPTRWTRTWILNADRPDAPPVSLWDQSADDWYADPGDPVMKPAASGESLILQQGDVIYLAGAGGSPEGDHPFLDRLNLRTRQVERLFRAESGTYEVVLGVLGDSGRRILTQRETKETPPNFYVRDLEEGSQRALTRFADPAPQLAGITKQLIRYERADGVPLTGELYLPAGYRQGERLPTFIWAYPREFADATAAGQVRGSPNRFTTFPKQPSHLYFVTLGYAVLDGASMPITGGATANDTYVEQLVANAEAAVDKLVEMGVSDRERIGVGGRSYGAFMTMNLLVHSDLFRTGVAHSGAYNRTLTPFGFQYERRTFWEAPEVYFRMSPFIHADRINEPVLMIHGMADPNAGTFPIQSERLYHALKGLGATARLVMLPNEGHGYSARESIHHSLAEMIDWLDTHLKNAPTTPRTMRN